MPFDFAQMFSNPNFLQGLGNAGEVIGSGGSFAEALNPADLIRQIQTQKAGQDILGRIFGQGGVTPTTQPTQPLNPEGQTPGLPDESLLNLAPTPVGTAGPDSVTRKQTADGTTTTVQSPSDQNLSTFGTNVPPEAIVPQPKTTGAGGPQAFSPFFQDLLGMG